MNTLSKTATRSISKLSNKLRRRINAFSSKDTFSGAQGRALHFLLAQTEDVFQKDLEEELGLRAPTASELLKKMEKNGLIVREPVAYDARLKKITMTDQAMQYKSQVIEDLSGLEQELTKGIAKKDLAVFCKVAEMMQKNLG